MAGVPEADPTCDLEPIAQQGAQKARHECCPTQECGQEETNGQKDDAHLQGLDPLPVKSDQGMLIVPDFELARGRNESVGLVGSWAEPS